MYTFTRSKTLAVVILCGCLLVPILSGIGAPAPKDSEVTKLLKERLTTTAKIYDMSKVAFQAGQMDHDEVLRAQAALLNAKLAVCDSKDERVKVHVEMVDTAKEMVGHVSAQVASGVAGELALLNAQAQLLDVQIGLERAKAEK